MEIGRLRSLVSQHLLSFEDYYKSMTTLGLQYQSGCKALEKNGTWDVELGDIIPAALANMLQCEVKIFTSSLLRPFMEFIPTRQCVALFNLRVPYLQFARCDLP